MHRGLGLLLRAQLYGRGAADDARAVPQGAQAVGGAGEAQKVERVRDRVGVKRREAVEGGV
ncbi:hypothetical protein D3C78_1656590 [compost metagenome]